MVYSAIATGTRIDYNAERSANSRPRSLLSSIPNLALGAWRTGHYRLQHARLTGRLQLGKYFDVVWPSTGNISLHSNFPMDGTFHENHEI